MSPRGKMFLCDGNPLRHLKSNFGSDFLEPFMKKTSADDLYTLDIGYSDSDVAYNECVVYPTPGNPIQGEFHLEPFDSLYDRFIAFEIAATQEIETRAKDTWGSIVDFARSIDEKSIAADSPYCLYFKQIERLHWSITMSETGYRDINYPALVHDFFKQIERQQSS